MSSNVAMCVYFDKAFKDTQQIVETINKRYCKKHNIKYITQYDGVNLSSYSGKYKDYYHKFFLARDVLATNDFDYVFMLDADAVVLDHDIDIRIFTKMTDKDIMICAAEDGKDDISWNVNTGSIIFSNNKKVITFLMSYFQGASTNNYELNDQDLFQFMMKAKMTDIVSVFPSKAFNGQGQFIYHACNHSTLYEDVETAINKKNDTLKKVIKNEHIL